MKTLIAIPCMSSLPREFSQSMDYLIKGENVSILYKPDSLIYDARNLISLTAIENNFDRVMWFDSDMVFQPETMQILHKDMDLYGYEMVSGLYVKRHFPVEPVIYEKLDEPQRTPDGHLAKQIVAYSEYPEDDLFPVAGCGFGCVMTSVPLLKAVWAGILTVSVGGRGHILLLQGKQTRVSDILRQLRYLRTRWYIRVYGGLAEER